MVQEEIDKMRSSGIIKPSFSPCSVPIVLAVKKYRNPPFCVDYRALNQVIKHDQWPLPHIDQGFDDLGGSKFFTTREAFSGYWQILMSLRSREKTTFVCPQGKYKFGIRHFGLKNAPSTFHRMLDSILGRIEFARVCIDDVVVFSETLEEHVKHVAHVLRIVAEHRVKLKKTKCHFAQRKIEMLGHVVDETGVHVDMKSIREVREAPIPTTFTQLRILLGLAGYYRRFIKIFADKLSPHHAATSGKKKLARTEEMRIAFKELNIKLTLPPVFAFLDFGKAFRVKTNGFSNAVAAILSQEKETGNTNLSNMPLRR